MQNESFLHHMLLSPQFLQASIPRDLMRKKQSVYWVFLLFLSQHLSAICFFFLWWFVSSESYQYRSTQRWHYALHILRGPPLQLLRNWQSWPWTQSGVPPRTKNQMPLLCLGVISISISIWFITVLACIGLYQELLLRKQERWRGWLELQGWRR